MLAVIFHYRSADLKSETYTAFSIDTLMSRSLQDFSSGREVTAGMQGAYSGTVNVWVADVEDPYDIVCGDVIPSRPESHQG